MTRGPRPVDRLDPLRVQVVAEHALVGESVRTALRALGLAPAVVPVGGRHPAGRSEVGLLLTASTLGSALGAMVMWECSSIPWLVLAPEPAGSSWEAFYESGATLVVAPDASLEKVCGLLNDLSGRSVSRTSVAL